MQIAVQRHLPAAAFLGGSVWQLNCGPDGTGRIGDHVSGEMSHLTGAETGFRRQQHHYFIARRLSCRFGVQE